MLSVLNRQRVTIYIPTRSGRKHNILTRPPDTRTPRPTEHRNDSEHTRCPEVGLGCIDQDPNSTSGHPNPTSKRTSKRLGALSVSRGRIRMQQNQNPNSTSGHPNPTSKRTSKRLEAHSVSRGRFRNSRFHHPRDREKTNS